MAKVSKVQKSDGTVIMDISQDNVNANNLLQGGTAHGSDGEAVQGAVIVAPTDVTEVSDTTPYIYKSSEHDAVYDELVGASVNWNQLVANSGSSLSVTITSGHKYVMKKSGTLSVGASGGSAITGLTGGTDWITDLTLMFGSTTIADYAYNLEQSTAGSGIAWLKSYGFFTKDYYPYSAGALTSVNVSGKKVVGKNLFKITSDNSVDNGITFIANKADGTVTINGTASGTAIYQVGQFTFDAGVSYFFSGGIANGIYLRPEGRTDVDSKGNQVVITEATKITRKIYAIVSSGAMASNLVFKPMIRRADVTDSTFEPYTSLIYPIQSTDLRGLYKLSGSKLYTDGDIYSADGQITRKYGIVDLGTLEWSYPGGDNNYFRADIPNIKTPNNNSVFNAINSQYVVVTWSSWYSNRINKTCGFGNDSRMYVTDTSYTDAATFKTAMSGVYLIYELATPTTVTASSYTSPQMVYRNGTEEYLDTRDVPIPVGGNRKYVDIPEWMVNEYFDDVRAETSTLKTISKLQQENEVLRNALSQSTFFIPEGTTTITESIITDRTKCFYYIPNSVTSIGEYAFWECTSLTSITIPNGVTSIGKYAFLGCTNLTSITISDSVTGIGEYAFKDCTSLTSIIIPNSVTSIGEWAFDECTSLTDITVNKPQGSISGAPWGAPNATVTWTG